MTPSFDRRLPDLTKDWIDEPYPEDVSQLLLIDDSSGGDDSDLEYDENEDSLSSNDDKWATENTIGNCDVKI